ncbi:MAG TPA: GTP-binding protein, partial [Candidatus Limnocylindrales bacterium]|nr:GTP-binding protein [Candidatus Limnocylindrales bacterium]
GAILVVSAVEGVQPQTPLLFRALRRLDVPTLVFLNKIDRAGADPERVLAALRRRLSPAMVVMSRVIDPGTRDATVEPETLDAEAARLALTELLAAARLRTLVAEGSRGGLVHPVFFGSAARGVGVDALIDGLAELLPAADGDPAAQPSGRIFKIERTASGERVAYLRLFAGELRPRMKVSIATGDEAKPSAISTFAPGTGPRPTVVRAGQMARVWGLGAVRVGDPIGVRPPGDPEATRPFPLPTLESVVDARRPEERGSLRAALNQLAEQDPLINVRQDDRGNDISVSLYGEVQKEVIAATLERDYGIEAEFRDTTTLCIEWPARSAEADEVIAAKTKTNITGRSSPLSTNPFVATMGLRVEPLPLGAGIEFRLDVESRLVPLFLYRTNEAFLAAMEANVREALEEGLAGWPVTDCRVTMWDCGYTSPRSSVQDFRRLTQLVLATALERAGTWVCQPLAAISLELPSESAPGTLAVLSRIGGRVTGQFSANGLSHVRGVLPVARVRDLQHQLPGLTGGEAVLETRFGGYQPVGDHPPRRERSSPSPLQRDEWLAWLARRP